LLAETNLQ